MRIPHFQLSIGQVAWAINLGQKPSQVMLDQFNYLRQRGVPFSKEDLSAGSGNRILMNYDELIESGVALAAIDNGMKAGAVSKTLVGERSDLRKLYRQALRDQPEAALTASWVKSRGREIPLLGNELHLRLHDRYSETPGKIEVLESGAADAPQGALPFDMVERYPGYATHRLLPLTRLALQWVAWALEAPEIKPGPKA